MIRRILVCALAASGIHLLLGWAWTAAAGVLAGWWGPKKGWLVGALAVGLGWGTLVLYSFFIAREPFERMTEVVGGIFAGIPGALVPVATVLMGALLGTAGGLLGTSIRRFRL